MTGYEFKTEKGLFNYNWDGLEEESYNEAQHQQQQVLNIQNNKSSFLKEAQPWQLINLRLPLSGTLKNQMINSSKGSTSAVGHVSIGASNMPTATQSNYNLSNFIQNYHHLHCQQLSLRHKVKNCSFNNSLINLNHRVPSLVSTPQSLHQQTVLSSAVNEFPLVEHFISGAKSDRDEFLMKVLQNDQDDKLSVTLQQINIEDDSKSRDSKNKKKNIETITKDETEILKSFEDNNDKQDNVIDYTKDSVNLLDSDAHENNNNFSKFINNSGASNHIHLNHHHHHHHHGHGNNAVTQPLLAKINS